MKKENSELLLGVSIVGAGLYLDHMADRGESITLYSQHRADFRPSETSSEFTSFLGIGLVILGSLILLKKWLFKK